MHSDHHSGHTHHDSASHNHDGHSGHADGFRLRVDVTVPTTTRSDWVTASETVNGGAHDAAAGSAKPMAWMNVVTTTADVTRRRSRLMWP